MPSQYENRTEPAYESVMNSLVRPEMANNPHILSWWISAHDDLIKEAMNRWEWYWHFYVKDEVLARTDPATIERWIKEDPACQRGIGKGAWYNVLQYFAYARAEKIGLSKLVRPGKWKTCPLCNVRFLESSLPEPLARRMGVQRLDYCAPCLATRILQSTGNDQLSPEEVKSYLHQLSSILESIPHQGFGEGEDDILFLDDDKRLAVLRLFSRKPRTRLVKKLFNSWLQALIEAEVLEDGTRNAGRGTMCIAKDGHICYSLGEKTIDDFPSDHGVPHTKEPHYPDSNYRADFGINGFLVEYFGLVGEPSYDRKTNSKLALAKETGINVVAIYPKDLVNHERLTRLLLSV